MPLINDDEETEDTPVIDTPVDEEPTEEPIEDTDVEEVEPNVPSIELIIEDGTGVANANSYCDLDYALEYCTMKGYSDWLNYSEDEQKIFIIRGTEFVNNYYTWKGVRRYINQSCAFPREGVYDIDHYRVDGIPEALKKACLEAAWLNATSGTDTLFTMVDINGKVKKQKVDTLEVEYFSPQDSQLTNNNNVVDYTTIYDILNKLLKGLYKTGTSSSKVCSRVVQTGW